MQLRWVICGMIGFLSAGCTVDFQQTFEGKLTGLASSNVEERCIGLGGEVRTPSPGGGLYFHAIGLGLEDGYFVMLYELPQGMEKLILRNDMIREAWLFKGAASDRLTAVQGPFEFAQAFAGGTLADRQRVEGAIRLIGKVDVKRYRSDTDYRIVVSLRSETLGEVEMIGEYRSWETWGFRPLGYLALLTGSGWGSPAQKPVQLE